MVKKKLNTVQNGKGSKERIGTNWKAYWESEYWDNIAKKKALQNSLKPIEAPLSLPLIH